MTAPRARLEACLSSPRLRWGLGGLAVVAIGAAAIAMTARPQSAAADVDSPLIQIRLVAPTEPEVEPGAVMDVGRLRDDFDRAALARAEAARRAEQAAAQAALAYVDDAYVEGDEVATLQTATDDYEAPRVILPAPPRREIDLRREYAGAPGAYGFDIPRPDYAAERRARREAWEARAAQEAARRDRAYADARY
ncbi:hypothetical protein [Brevundimonas sp.]|jgi:hypothetical protein|uniref:hypothetical protein n=1 Tax=Brevundimonas sp. TaxID=1871086 RepID=UPI0035B1EC04